MAGQNWESFVFASDNHGDQCDPGSLRKLYEFCDDFKPKHRIHGGDLFDFRPLRKGANAEERAEKIHLDIVAGQEFLERFRPDTLLLGNHDVRLWEAMDSNCGVVATLAMQMLEKLQGEASREPALHDGGLFSALGIKNMLPYHRKKGVYPLGDINFLHGYRATMYPAKAHAENYGPTCITGHVHKYDVHVTRHVNGGYSMSAPCLADLNMGYLDRTVAALAHDNGFIFGVVNTRTGKSEAWCVRRHQDENLWIDPRAPWI